MCLRVLVLYVLCVGVLLHPCLGCFKCFIPGTDVNLICKSYIKAPTDKAGTGCQDMIDRSFNNNKSVIEASKVGSNQQKDLESIIKAELQVMLTEFAGKQLQGFAMEKRMQGAADNFIEAASKLPKSFQKLAQKYSCATCTFDVCRFPLDCPTSATKVKEGSSFTMRCDVNFTLPDKIEVVWRFAEELNTQQVQAFKEVTVGDDRIFTILSIRLHQQGTYQCEISSDRRSIVRLYFYLAVTPQDVQGHTDLQELFDQALLPEEKLVPGGTVTLRSLLLSLLLTVCLTATLLLLFLSMW